MKKLLLSAFAALFAGSTFAYEIGEYAYTQTQRVKILGSNMVGNSNFAGGSTDGWTAADGAAIDQETTWAIEPGVGPNNENVLKSLGANAGAAVCQAFSLDGGTYLVSYQIKVGELGTAASTAGVDIFVNTDGALTKVASTDEAPVTTVSGTVNYTDEWQTVNYVATISDGGFLVFHIESLPTDVMVTNFTLQQAELVWDIRIAERKFAFARKLADDPNFNIPEAEDARITLLEVIENLEGAIAAGQLDQEPVALNAMDSFNEELNNFLDVASTNLATEENFKYITDLTAFPKRNRKDIKAESVHGGFLFRQDGAAAGAETNWTHGNGSAYLSHQIQAQYANPAASVELHNNSVPAGKYYVAADVRTSLLDKNYVQTFTIEKNVRGFVGSDSSEVVPVQGEDFVKLYFIGEVKEGENFGAGFWWEGHDAGSTFQIMNFEIRSFGNVADEMEHKAAWNAFIAQWNAAVSAREAVVDKIGNKNYPWEQDSLKRALDLWDPYYNDIIAKGWVDANGNDAGVATTEELNDWALYQGVELYSEPDEYGDVTRLEYQVVRGYQNASNYVTTVNQPIADLQAEIKKATDILNDDKNVNGDKFNYEMAIEVAQEVLDNILTNTTDATREADIETINTAIAELKYAEEVFLATAQLEPFVSIDYSNPFKEVVVETEDEEGIITTTTTYAIEGEGASMNFGTMANPTDNTAANYYALGYNEDYLDVLRVGKGNATVELPVAIADDEVLRVNFDIWFGKLINRVLTVQLLNAAGERVGGFEYGAYDVKANYNDFNNEANEGMDIVGWTTGIGSSSTQNSAICAENNCSSFTLIVDYKALTLQGMIDNPQKGSHNGARMPMLELDDQKVTKFVLSSTYENADRRCWFDNLKMYKYKSSAEGPMFDGINEVATNNAARVQGVFTLSGVKVAPTAEQLPAGLYIINGKKVVIR